jgi:hypothetical protein
MVITDYWLLVIKGHQVTYHCVLTFPLLSANFCDYLYFYQPRVVGTATIEFDGINATPKSIPHGLGK